MGVEGREGAGRARGSHAAIDVAYRWPSSSLISI